MQTTKRWHYILLLCLLMLALVSAASAQPTVVTAEAVGQANLRAMPDVNAALLGQIQAGTRYPVLGRSEFYPWLLLGDPATNQPIGWVFQDLVTISGNIGLVALSTLEVGSPPPLPSPTLGSSSPMPTGTLTLIGVALPTATPTSANAIVGLVTGDINIRYGPGIDFPRIGFARAGATFEIVAWHTQFPWVQIRYADAPNGFGWVAKDLLDIQGDLFSLPSLSQTRFDLPTLTPTAPAVQASNLLASAPVSISPQFQALGNQLWNMILEAGFEPGTSRLGGLFLMDLQTREAITFGNEVAFSGMSLNKIPILADLYSTLNNPPNEALAIQIANMMLCSENSASNNLLTTLGNGDPLQGAQAVTTFMRQLGLGDTFIVAPFLIDPRATPAPVVAPTTSVDQVSASPDYSNQLTVDEMGWLLTSIYQCAYQDDSPLLTNLPGAFDSRECRQMIDLMSSNNLAEPLLMSAGVPENTRVAHKHGWTADTHGDAGIVFTPGGDYVLVVVLHSPTWLDFSESFPLITEISRTVYNYYNPASPMETTREPYIVPVEECRVADNPIIDLLTSVSG